MVPVARDISPAHWSDVVCPQTTDATCSAASATTLLHTVGIAASESEIARLCLTRREGTTMLGAYRGLRRKTEGTPFYVRVLTGTDLRALWQIVGDGGPVLLSVGIDYWQRGHIDPRYESLWGWTPGKRHAIVLFGFLPDGKLDIGDPSIGREQWKSEALSILWHGDALQIVPRRH